MHQNCSLEKQVWCLTSCFSQQKFTDVSVNCFNAQEHLSRALFHKRQVASRSSPAQTKWLLPSLWAQSSVLSHQSRHLQINSWPLQQVKMFLQMVLNWFSPLQEWEDGKQLFNSFQRSNTQQLQKKCGEVALPRLQEPPAEWNSISEQTYFWEILFGPLNIIDSPGLGDK